MDRTAFTACAGLLLPLSAAWCAAADPSLATPSSVPAIASQRLPSAAALAEHAPETLAATHQADQRVREAFGRAARGAPYSARADFLAALETIARAHDAEKGTQSHATALRLGLVALRESGDFVARRADQAPLDVASIITSHRSTVLKDGATEDISAPTAAERYCSYAQEQLARAAAGEPAASMALFGLAKVTLVSSSAQQHSANKLTQAAALYRAALLANRANFCAANELAVLLADSGRLTEAKGLLLQSVSISPQATVSWRNLSVVHARLGETLLAEQAKARADVLPIAPGAGSVPAVEWLDPQSFSRVRGASEEALPSPLAAAPPTAVEKTAGKSAPQTAKKPNSNRRSPPVRR
ncbi:MAG: hypothetical protein AB7O59_11560 [Pirellulales bacterium]